MADISVIICAYTEKRWQDLQAAVNSVKEQSLPPKEIIVVIDNNPSLAARARKAFDHEMVVENKNPRGLSGARNCGIDAGCGQIIAFLDDDAVADPDWLEILISHYEDPNVIG